MWSLIHTILTLELLGDALALAAVEVHTDAPSLNAESLASAASARPRSQRVTHREHRAEDLLAHDPLHGRVWMSVRTVVAAVPGQPLRGVGELAAAVQLGSRLRGVGVYELGIDLELPGWRPSSGSSVSQPHRVIDGSARAPAATSAMNSVPPPRYDVHPPDVRARLAGIGKAALRGYAGRRRCSRLKASATMITGPCRQSSSTDSFRRQCALLAPRHGLVSTRAGEEHLQCRSDHRGPAPGPWTTHQPFGTPGPARTRACARSARR